jgi:uncharacterized coiled-coil protein SlyX
MSYAMSADQMEELEKRLDSLNGLAGLMKIVVGGAVGVGIWVGAIQFQVNASTKMNDDNQERLRTLEIRGATVDQRLENIYELVRKIDTKLNP